MNESALFLDPVQTMQFLSLFTYLNKLSDIFYAEQLIKEEDKGEPFIVVNTFYEYLNKTKNETELKEQIVHKLLEGSDLYGGGENETLDMEYVNSTFDYIVSNVVFAQSGNVYGYLAEVVSKSTSLKFSVFKKTILEHLSYLRNINDNGDVSNLTELATVKIAETLLWPLFPEPSNDLEIISVTYIYGLAGHKLAQSAQINTTEISFEKYVTLAMTIEASAIGNKLPNSILQFFALPALIYYAHKETEELSNQPMKHLIKDKEFWSSAFLTLFGYLNSTFEAIRQEAIATNSLYQFHQVMSNFKNRTFIARDLLHKHCNHLNESYLESVIDDYKTFSASTICPNSNELLPKFLPNLEEVYDAQFYQIQEKYRLLELEFIRSAFDEFPHIRDSINSTNTTVYPSHPKMKLYCYMCIQMPPAYKQNVHLFAIEQEDQIEFFALEQNENNVTLLLEKNSSKEFNKRVGLPQNTEQEIFTFLQPFKESGKDFKYFVEKFAEMRAKDFKKQLFDYGYDQTSMEKFFEIIQSFIPFYNCVKHANAGEQGLATFSCLGDVVSLIPFAGVLNLGFKISSITVNRFLLAAELSLKTYTFRQAIFTTMTVGLRNAAIGLSEMFSKVVFTKQMLKTVSISTIRTLDPGFELVGKLTLGGRALLGSVMKNSFKRITKKFPTLNFKFGKYESIWQDLTKNGVKPADNFEIVSVPESKIEGRDVFRFIYPGGNEPYGPKYIHLSKGFAELRQIIGFKTPVPVVVSKVSKRGKTLYRRINLQTEEQFGLEMKLNKHSQLENVKQPFQEHLYKIKTEGLSGKGAVHLERLRSIEDAVKVIGRGKNGISSAIARKKLKHYVLSTAKSTTVEDLKNVKLMKFHNFNNFKSDELHDLIKEYKMNPLADLDLNNYFSVPTYTVFALDWIRTGTVSPIYAQYYVEDVVELEYLLYINKQKPASLNEAKNLKNNIIVTYGQKYLNDNQKIIDDAIKSYFLYSTKKNVDFEDYYAVYNWRSRKFMTSENLIIEKLLHKSLYRLAVRQSTDETVSKVLYHFDIKDRLPLGTDFLKLDKKITSNNFIISTSDESQLFEKFSDMSKKLAESEKKQIFVYKSFIDSSYLTIDLSKIMFMKYPVSVILPGTRFEIKKVEERIISGYNVVYFELYNVPIAKEVIIANLMRHITKLNHFNAV